MKQKIKNKTKKKRSLDILLAVLAAGLLCLAVFVFLRTKTQPKEKSPVDILTEYMHYIVPKQYEKMYSILDVEGSDNISQDDFTTRNSAIYEGIEIQNLEVNVTGYDEEKMQVNYHTSFDTIAGKVSFDNTAYFSKGEDGYALCWEDGLIYPGLKSTDKVKVSRTAAERGQILDRNDYVLAGKTGTAELKATKGDTSGTEIGWFSVFTTEQDMEKPILLISMVENVKDKGGSGYVVEKDKAVLDAYLPDTGQSEG